MEAGGIIAKVLDWLVLEPGMMAHGQESLSGFVDWLFLKHQGATEGERDKIIEAKPDNQLREWAPARSLVDYVERHWAVDDIGPLWAKHFPKIGERPGSKVVVLPLVYMIEDKAKARAVDGDWANRVSRCCMGNRVRADFGFRETKVCWNLSSFASWRILHATKCRASALNSSGRVPCQV